MELQDKVIKCRDCGNEFTFTVGEQEFYRQKGFEHAPTRCKNCRENRKPGSGGGGGGGGMSSGNREMFSAVCSSCGAETQVPFNPSPGKPVYCRDCYQARKR
jgi:CxxC-x17-CxxC domain-containing protein